MFFYEIAYVTVQTKTKFDQSKSDENKIIIIMNFFLPFYEIIYGVLKCKKSMQNLFLFGSYIKKCNFKKLINKGQLQMQFLVL